MCLPVYFMQVKPLGLVFMNSNITRFDCFIIRAKTIGNDISLINIRP